MNMREKMAQILRKRFGETPDDDIEGFFGATDEILDALMEPTEGMLEAADEYWKTTNRAQDNRLIYAGISNAMIRAAKEGK